MSTMPRGGLREQGLNLIGFRDQNRCIVSRIAILHHMGVWINFGVEEGNKLRRITVFDKRPVYPVDSLFERNSGLDQCG